MEGPVFEGLGWSDLVRSAARLGVAAALGGLVGLEREHRHRSAGLRTHMLVSLGTASFVLLATDMAQRFHVDPTRVIQGVVQGIGFLAAGTIVKATGDREVQGLTTASGIWAAAAIGLSCGSGWLNLGLVTTAFALCIIVLMRYVEVDKPH
jgi:putative Mg2+ transporter-C (MgtC) family protein